MLWAVSSTYQSMNFFGDASTPRASSSDVQSDGPYFLLLNCLRLLTTIVCGFLFTMSLFLFVGHTFLMLRNRTTWEYAQRMRVRRRRMALPPADRDSVKYPGDYDRGMWQNFVEEFTRHLRPVRCRIVIVGVRLRATDASMVRNTRTRPGGPGTTTGTAPMTSRLTTSTRSSTPAPSRMRRPRLFWREPWPTYTYCCIYYCTNDDASRGCDTRLVHTAAGPAGLPNHRGDMLLQHASTSVPELDLARLPSFWERHRQPFWTRAARARPTCRRHCRNKGTGAAADHVLVAMKRVVAIVAVAVLLLAATARADRWFKSWAADDDGGDDVDDAAAHVVRA